jgi:hypothetical protein
VVVALVDEILQLLEMVQMVLVEVEEVGVLTLIVVLEEVV